MKLITFVVLGMIIMISVVSVGAYAFVKSADFGYISGTTEDYSVAKEDFRLEVNGEIATIQDGKLASPGDTFVVPIKGKYKTSGTVKITNTENNKGIIIYNLGVGTGDYAKASTKWSFNRNSGWFSWRSPDSLIFGKGTGLHVLSGSPEMNAALESIRVGDEIVISGYDGEKIILYENGKKLTRGLKGCHYVVVTDLKIKKK
ncbi:MAG: hypothetical protein J7K00_01085 [Candidatus Diapherotrites archaeon]|nr:hypothetical protein [Candidatus Diapherotrites archaeon]